MKPLVLTLLLATAAFAQTATSNATSGENTAKSATAGPNAIAEVNAELGPCTVQFVVTDKAGKGLYNARVRAVVRHGFLSKRKMELEVATNSDGIARMAGLPESVRKPITIEVTHPIAVQRLTHDPITSCKAEIPVKLQ